MPCWILGWERRRLRTQNALKHHMYIIQLRVWRSEVWYIYIEEERVLRALPNTEGLRDPLGKIQSVTPSRFEWNESLFSFVQHDPCKLSQTGRLTEPDSGQHCRCRLCRHFVVWSSQRVQILRSRTLRSPVIPHFYQPSYLVMDKSVVYGHRARFNSKWFNSKSLFKPQSIFFAFTSLAALNASLSDWHYTKHLDNVRYDAAETWRNPML